MPKIAAPTVAEHRAQVQARLVDAAEEILRAGDGAPLTAGAVSSAAGIARNSIYRYVDSVDELRGMVVARHLPAWLSAVDEAVAGAEDPRARLVAWVRANLDQAAATGHGWLMEAMRTTSAGSATPSEAVDQAHAVMRDVVVATWLDLLGGDEQRSAVAAAMTLAIVETGFRQLDAGRPADLVTDLGARATAGLVDGLATSVQQ
jgi:AcrR family transcriptional regulator